MHILLFLIVGLTVGCFCNDVYAQDGEKARQEAPPRRLSAVNSDAFQVEQSYSVM